MKLIYHVPSRLRSFQTLGCLAAVKSTIRFYLLVTLAICPVSEGLALNCQPYWTAEYKCMMGCGCPGGGNNGGGNSGPSQAQIDAQNAAAAQQAAAQKAAAAQKQRADEAQALAQQGTDAANRDDYDTALKYLQDALEKAPDDPTIKDYIQKAKDALAAKKKREQEAFDRSKQESLSQLKGLAPNGATGSDPGLKSIGSADSGLKGLDDNPMELKDAVADHGGEKKLFKTKNAIQDALSASAYGQDANNPDLGASLERAKVEINKVFDNGAPNRGHFDTIVIAGDSGAWTKSPAQPVPVPVELQSDKRFQKLVVERDALRHQAQDLGKQIQAIKSDPAYVPDGQTLTKIDKLQAAQNGVSGMAGHLDNLASDVVQKKVTIDSLDFSDSGPPPKRGLDGGSVPPPSK